MLQFRFYFCKAMAYVPDIIDYKPFYIQTDADGSAVDTTEWGLVAKSTPFPILPTPKEVYYNEWLDEDGDDEYNAEMAYESFEFEVAFYVKTLGEDAEKTLVDQVEDFFSKIRQGEFMVYDSYTGLGRRGVRYAGYSEDSFKRTANWARAIFSVTFKVNDPITRIVLSDGKLIEA